jgi:hypothetical protein
MVPSLNKSICIGLLGLCSFFGTAQEDKNYDQFEDRKVSEQDFQDQKAFKKYGRRSVQVAAWQVQNLKFGALVVRLQNNKRKIEAYRKVGNEQAALETIARTQYLNKVLMKSFMARYNFSKVYFIYAQSSDSLLKGVKQGIFIDTTLKVNNSIVMNENYYILEEPDYVYNSTIGFVKEDSAKFVTEAGARTVYAPMVLKNKYGHQLKDPFPFYVNKYNTFKNEVINVSWPVEVSEGVYKNVPIELDKEYSGKVWDFNVESLNVHIHDFYQKYAGLQLKDPGLKPFLY